MRRALLALVCSALAAGCSTGSDQVDVNNGGEFRFVAATPSGEVIPEDERAAAPQFSGRLLETGDVFESSQLAGQVGVLNFWGSWCAPFQISFPSLYDPRGEIALAFRDYPANAIPSTIVLDQDGRVAAVYTGEVSREDLRRVLDRVLEEV
jgi:hypothetical protein